MAYITALRVSAVDSLKNLLGFAILHLKLWLQKIFNLGRKSICYKIGRLLMPKNYLVVVESFIFIED